MPNKLSQFWQELKRRNVTRVLAVYIAAAFMMLELVDMTTEPFGLPEWSMKVAFFILLGGLVIAVIVSWIYDIHPKGGMVKTEPFEKVKAEDMPKSSNSWKIASYISFVVILGLIVLNVIPRSNSNRKILEKSIAVLPLNYLSEYPDKEYLANGVLDAITGHLSMIEGLRVMPRTSVEQYRESTKSAKAIGEELNVSYLIEGSFLMVDNRVKLTIQLVVAEEGDNLFFKEYDRDYSDIFFVQSEVAQTIAREIEVAITPDEKVRIEKIPTTSLTAYDLYQKGREEYVHYTVGNDNKELLTKSEQFYNDALEYDSTFALAYIGKARIFWDRHFWDLFFTEDFLDSVLILANKATSIDPKLSDAFSLRGDYYREMGHIDKALQEYETAIIFNPNDWAAYFGLGSTNRSYNNLVESLENMHKAIDINRGPELPQLLRNVSWTYAIAGYYDKAIYYVQEVLKLTKDSANYLASMTAFDYWYGNYESGVKYGEMALEMNPNNSRALEYLGDNYSGLGLMEEALMYYNKQLSRLEETGIIRLNNKHRIALLYLYNGKKEEANRYFNLQIEYCLQSIELGRMYASSKNSYYDLAGIFAFKGEKDLAYENLEIFNQLERMTYIKVSLLKNDPLFDSIRDEPEFQQIFRDVKAKYQAEHERVRLWITENNML